jgi:hypothetical protein
MNTNDFEYTQHITTDMNPDGYWVGVNKVGGGTVGQKYTGYWDATVYDGDENELWHTDGATDRHICTRVFQNHLYAACLALDVYEGTL